MASPALTPRALLIRGMLVGVASAALAFLFARLFGVTAIDQAIAFETAHADPTTEEPVLVTRAVQSTVGLGTAVLVYGAALGGIFGLAFAFSFGRIGVVGVRTTSMGVAGIGFIALFLVPFLKYPSNPPATGNPDTIAARTALYFLMVAISVAAAVGAVVIARRLIDRLDVWDAVLVAVGAFVVVIAVAMLILPAVNEIPADFSAAVLWRFRVASVGTQLVLWATIGALFGALTDSRVRRNAHPVAAG